MTLKLAPGTATTERELVETVGLGRTPVREAILRLAWEGLLEVRPRSGLRVAPLHPEDWLRVIDARRGVEALLARNAARAAVPNRRAIVSGAAEAMRRALEQNDVESFLRADKAMDEAVAQLAGNVFAVRTVAPLQAHSRRFWFRFQAATGLGEAGACHLQLADAILLEQEAEAEAATSRLMDLLADRAKLATQMERQA